MDLLLISPHVQEILKGVIIVAAVLLDRFRVASTTT
jgi:ribose/xylose/arabinose/galactoside ABC-type transport system permease subunit